MATLIRPVPDMKERILACALDQYLKHGRRGFSLRQVADGLEVSATAIYRYYHGRDDLLRAIAFKAEAMLVEYLLPALSERDPERRLSAALSAYLEFALRRGKYFEAVFLAPWDPDADPDSGIAPYVLRFLSDRVDECMDAGVFRKEDPAAVAMSLWAVLQGQILLYLQGKCPADEEQLRMVCRDSHQRLLRGLLP